ncbi:NepR family anti-sigma factor [Sphingobium sp.]|uniref:NepR family anti-sigma factor n=1 Tax=Sphingobium sp. TaxID=1912891 RepID=UPI0028BD3E77|nr:NepR family anti-sigma factor [Sphingobium sp.]
MILMAAEGRVLVASTTERDVTGGDRKDVGTGTPASGVKSGAGRRKRTTVAKDDGQVANALRSVYQRAVDEDIPAEMLDLLNKLD